MKIGSILFFLLNLAIRANALDIDSLEIGQWGGISGRKVIYRVVDNTIKKGEGLGSIKFEDGKTLKRFELDSIYKLANQVRLKVTPFDKPYNITKCIKIYVQNSVFEYKWGRQTDEIPSLSNLYYYIINIVSP